MFGAHMASGFQWSVMLVARAIVILLLLLWHSIEPHAHQWHSFGASRNLMAPKTFEIIGVRDGHF